MKGKVQDRAKVGIVTFMAYPIIKGVGPVEESLAALAADDYFQLLEITHVEDDTVRSRCQKIFKQKGKSAAYGAQPVCLMNKLNLNHPDAAERTKALDLLKKHIDEAYTWSAAGFAVLSGADPGPAGRAQGKELLVDSLRQLCEYSARKGKMPLLMEAFDQVKFGKNCLIGPSEDAAEVAQKVRKTFPSFGIMADLSHLPLLSETPRHCLGILKDVLTHAHIGNCVMRDAQHEAYGDNHPRFGIPAGENGLPELVEFLKALAEIGYFAGAAKPLSFEVKPCTGETSEEIVRESQKLLDQAWAQA
jgi:sugar phosphate isomerase/epimerase